MKSAIRSKKFRVLFFATFLLLVFRPESYSQCNTSTSICSSSAGPFNFVTPGPAVSTCLDWTGNGIGYILLNISTSGPLNMLINGNATNGFLDVAVFNIPSGTSPCTAIQNPANQIGCNYASSSSGCNQFGTAFSCASSITAPNVTAGQILMIVVENWSGISTSFTLSLGPPPGAQAGPPNPTINSVSPLCVNDPPVQLTTVEPGGVWSSTGGAVSSTGIFNPSVAGAGVHTVYYSMGAAPCDSTGSIQITVNAPPAISVSSNSPICPGSTLTLNATVPPGSQVSWSGPTGFVGTGTTVSIPNTTAAHLGNYTATVTDSNGCTADTSTIVTVSPALMVNEPSVCSGQTAQLIASGADFYSWSPSTGLSSTTNDTVFATITSTQTYIVTGTDSAGCQDTDTITVTVLPSPVAVAGADTVLDCANPLISLNGTGSSTGPGFSYLWSSTNGNIVSGGNTLNPVIDQAGIYTITVVDNASGCSSSDVVLVTINPNNPVANAGGSQSLNCNNPTVTLNGSGSTGNITSYNWTGPGIVSGGNTATPVIDQPGVYILEVENSTGCTSTDTVVISSDFTPPAADAGSGGVVSCQNPVLLLAGSPAVSGYTYEWSTTNGNIVSGANSINANVSEGGWYYLNVTGTNGCSATDSVYVNGTAAPVAGFSANPATGDAPLNVQFSNTSAGGGLTYSWDLGNGSSSQEANPSAVYEIPGSYEVILTVTDSFGCTDSYTLTIISLEPYVIFVPNVITPNGDGDNDFFVIETKGVQDLTLNIYNRWGILIHTITDKNEKWDGKKDGNYVSKGTYYYVISVLKENGETDEVTGFITVLR